MNSFRPPCWARALSLIFLVCCGCSFFRHQKLDMVASDHEQLAAAMELHLDTKHEAQLDEHQIVTSGPGEEVTERFAPDGGLAERVTRRWGASTSEVTLKQSTAGEEHLQIDAGVTDQHDKTQKIEEDDTSKMAPAMSCAVGGSLWALALIGALLFAWRVLRPRA